MTTVDGNGNGGVPVLAAYRVVKTFDSEGMQSPPPPEVGRWRVR